MPETRKPTVGRIVLFRSNDPTQVSTSGSDLEVPAMITRVWSDTCVNLHVFKDGHLAASVGVTSVCYDGEASGQSSSSWRWPPLAGAS